MSIERGNMRQTSNCSGFNTTFPPSAFGLLQVELNLQVKNKNAKNPSKFTNKQEYILNVKKCK